jgi:hypothetical protein
VTTHLPNAVTGLRAEAASESDSAGAP